MVEKDIKTISTLLSDIYRDASAIMDSGRAGSDEAYFVGEIKKSVNELREILIHKI